MKKITFSSLFLLSVFSATFLQAQPPDPPSGKRWVLNEKFSDEFNGTELDASKWYDYHPTWKGRPPGLFLPSQVSVRNGYLALRGEKMENDTVITNWDGSTNTFNVASGIVVPKSEEAYFGYYECRFKAAKTTMSSTFWFSTKQNYDGPEACNDKYQLEWDIQECIGREGDFNGSYFAKGMHSNAHFWYTDCSGEKHDIRSPQVIFESEELASENFNTYGGWWKNESEASYYFNNGEVKSHKFVSTIKSKPFDRPMGMNLASETYPYPWISLPTDEELADTSKNVCLYDWVRSYTLIDVDAPSTMGDQLIKNGGFETGSFAYWTGWGGNPREVVSNDAHSGTYAAHIAGPGAPEYVVSLRSHSTYDLSCYGKIAEGSGPIIFGIKDPSGNVLGSVRVTESSYTRKSFRFSTGSSGLQLKIYYYAPNEGDEGYADDFELFQTDPDGDPQTETVIFSEKIYFSDNSGEKTARRSLDFLITYMANVDREINLRLFNPDSILVGEQKYTALAGFGKKQFIMQLGSIPSQGYDYNLIADIRPIDSTAADTFQTAAYRFSLLNPADIQLTVLDLSDDSPLSGALVTINDSVKITDEAGRADFYSISPGTVPVQIEKEGYIKYFSDTISVRNDTTITVRLTPVSHSLAIYISNAHTGQPLENATISIDGEVIQSDHNGMAVHSIYSGDYNLYIVHERYADKSLSISISKDTMINIELEQTLANAKFVVKMDNASLSGASVTVAGKSGITSSVGIVNFYDLKTDTAYAYSVENQSELLSEDTLVLNADITLRLYYISGVHAGSNQGDKPRLYPNPAGNHIRVTGIEENCGFEISDIKGRILLSGILKNNGIIDVSELSSGIYILKPRHYPVLKFTLKR